MQKFFDITGLDPTMTIAFPVGLIVLWIALAILWDKKVRPYKIGRGSPTATFNNILGRTLRFMFKEDKNPVIPVPKDKKGKPKELPGWRQKLNKYFTWSKFNLIVMLAGVITTMYASMNAAWIWGFFLIVAGTRTSTVFQKRHAIFYRMFKVAASELKYPRGSDMNPWSHITIREWQNLTQPRETVVRFPAEYDTSDARRRETFERHFNSTVTNDNQWVYEWDGGQGTIVCKPVDHLPTMALYPGASQNWNEIALGPNADGVAVWDVKAIPHSLITGTSGAGKALDITTPVLTGAGMKTVGDLEVGDTVFDPEGNPTNVNHLHPIITPTKAYEFTFSNGEKIITDPEHLWETETQSERASRYGQGTRARARAAWLDETVAEKVRETAQQASAEDVISIAQAAEMIGKLDTTPVLRKIAREVGVAEVHRPKVKFHYNAQMVKQKQSVLTCQAEEFIKAYNSRTIKLSDSTPITKDQQIKLSELVDELRDTDTMTVDSIVEYVNATTVTANWIRSNFDTSLPLKDAVRDLSVSAESVAYQYPAKIFSYDGDTIDARQFAALVDVDYTQSVKSFFYNIGSKLNTSRTETKEVELIVPEKTVERSAAPVNMYPKRMFLERLLAHNLTPINDQRHKCITSQVRTTEEIADSFFNANERHSVRKAQITQTPERDLPLHPYVLGAWLGDGNSRDGRICGIDNDIFEHIISVGYAAHHVAWKNEEAGFRTVTVSGLKKTLSDMGLLLPVGYSIRKGETVKRIPSDYLTSSVEQRRELLRGLLDTDGTVSKSAGIQFTTTISELKTDVVNLVSTLGYVPSVSEKVSGYRNEDGKKVLCKRAYTITFQASPNDRLFNVERKNLTHTERFRGDKKMNGVSDAHYITDVREVLAPQMRCISVDSPSRLFLVGNTMIPTHNSTIQRNIIFHCIQHSDKWAFLGIDVKRVELSPYAKYDTAVMGIATTVEEGVEIMRYARDEMMDRYTEMESLGVNNFKDLPTPPKALMVMIDEVFMFLSPSGVKNNDEAKALDEMKGEASVIAGDIARLGRAAGVHLVMATQRPDAKVIYGELKQNLAMRIAAGRMDSIASNMTLDNEQATLLPGEVKGRGYAQVNGQGGPFQGYYADQDWIDKWLAGTLHEEEKTPVAEEQKKKAKKVKKSKATDASGSVNAKKKGGLLARMQAFNEEQFANAEDEDVSSDNEEFEDAAPVVEKKPKKRRKAAAQDTAEETPAPALVLDKDDEPDPEDLFAEDLGLESDHDEMKDVAAAFQEVEYDNEPVPSTPASTKKMPPQPSASAEVGVSLFDDDDEDFDDMFSASPDGDTSSQFSMDDLGFLDDDDFFVGEPKKPTKPAAKGNVPPKSI